MNADVITLCKTVINNELMRINMFRFFALSLLSLTLNAAAFGQSFVLDDFSFPNAGRHSSTPGESRAAFPPGTSGGAIFGLDSGVQVAVDRGLFGPVDSLWVTDGKLDLTLSSLVEIDWDFAGFNFDNRVVTWRDVSNTTNRDFTLLFEPFQTFSGTDSVFGRGGVTFTLAAGETRDFTFENLSGASDFTGFRILNQSGGTFTGSVESIVVVPEPASAMIFVFSICMFATTRRRPNA